MKKNLLIILFLFLSGFSTAQLSVGWFNYDYHSWCGWGHYGEGHLPISGITPPCNVSWIEAWGSPQTQQVNSINASVFISGLSAGPNNITISDASGDTLLNTVWVEQIDETHTTYVYTYSISGLIYPDRDSSNGEIYVNFGLSNVIGNMGYIPPFPSTFRLYDSLLNLVQTQQPILHYANGLFDLVTNIEAAFTNIPSGKYYVRYSICGGTQGLNLTIDSLRETPKLNPTFLTTPACGNNQVGKVDINLHPAFTTLNIFTTLDSGSIQISAPKYRISLSSGHSTNPNLPVLRDSILNDSTVTFTGLNSGNYTALVCQHVNDTLNRIISSHFITIGVDSNCSSISGKVFGMKTANCTQDANEGLINGVLVELNPGGHSANTDEFGNYQIIVPPGIYTVNQYAPFQFNQACPDPNTFTINVPTVGTNLTVNLEDSIPGEPDILINGIMSPARPGFNTALTVYYKNILPFISAPRVITVQIDTSLIFLSSDIAPDSIIGNVYYFTSVPITSNGAYHFSLYLNVPASTPLGTILISIVSIQPITYEINQSNNNYIVHRTVTGSYDPNDKITLSGITTDGYVSKSAQLDYHLRFQNTGTDTAFRVVIIDTLSPDIDIHSVQMLNASHGYRYETKPGNVLLFYFENLLLPDSTTDESHSHGYITYRVNQQSGNAHGTVIKNKADIYFDFNSPVTTNEVQNIIFYCDSMAGLTVSNDNSCFMQPIDVNTQMLFPMNYSFTLDSITNLSADSTVHLDTLSSGLHHLNFTVSNEYCSRTLTHVLNIFPDSKPVITWNEIELVSTPAVIYNWFLDGAPLPSADSVSCTPLLNGYYQVMVLDSNGCGGLSDSVLFNSVGLTGLNTVKPVLFPVPCGNRLSISGLEAGKFYTCSIFDLQGRIVMPGKVVRQPITLDLDNLSDGTYLLKLSSGPESWQQIFQKH